MAKLIYMAIASLDGYVADEDGRFEWAKPDEEVHAFVNDLERPIGTHLYGRRLYEVMIGWETMHTLPDQTPQTLDFAAIWQAAEKVVYSRTLETVSSARTSIAGEAIRAGLVDELQLIVNPIVVGGGAPSLPDDVQWELDLLDERRFANGVVYLRYRTRD